MVRVMSVVAALDVGTNTVQIVVATRGEDGSFEVRLERAGITRLGAGVDSHGRLSEDALGRAVAMIADFTAQARALGARDIAACATSAARDAANREDLVRRVREEASLDLEIISGEEEARLSFLAVQADFGGAAPNGRPLLAIDVGGGSTEVVVGTSQGPPAFRHSAQVGSVRLTERFVHEHPIPPSALTQMRDAAREAFRTLTAPPSAAEVVAVAATATSLFAVGAGLLAANHPGVHGGVLTRAALDETVARLAALSLPERQRVRGLDPKRADVVCAGGIVLSAALGALGATSCRVSDRGLRWGILRDRFGADLPREG